MERARLAALAILQVGLFSAVVHAEDEPSQTLIGQRVRILMAKPSGKTERIVGNVVAEDEQTLKLDRPGSKDPPVTIDRSTLTRVDRSVARGRKGTGAALGFLIGAVGGAAIGYAEADQENKTGVCNHYEFLGCVSGPSRGGTAALFGVMFGLIGAGVGAAVSPGERWQRVPEEGLHFSLGPAAGGGIGARVSLSFSGPPNRSR
jgi:RNase P/RNase MRP subunit p29